jgi:hypothetical protein
LSRLIFDIETDGLLDQLTKVHSLVVKDLASGTLYSATDNPSYASPDPDVVLISIAEGVKSRRTVTPFSLPILTPAVAVTRTCKGLRSGPFACPRLGRIRSQFLKISSGF